MYERVQSPRGLATTYINFPIFFTISVFIKKCYFIAFTSIVLYKNANYWLLLYYKNACNTISTINALKIFYIKGIYSVRGRERDRELNKVMPWQNSNNHKNRKCFSLVVLCEKIYHGCITITINYY
jgi:hypothetical protein